MSITCKAVVFEEPRRVTVREIELPDPELDDLVVRTLYSGVSTGTELWTLTGRYWSTTFPTVPGYQKVGVVEHVGQSASGYAEGDVVFLRHTRVAPDVNVEWAGHTGMSVVNAAEPELLKLPEAVSAQAGSQLCMPAVGYHGAVDVMPVASGESVAVIGLGMIGQFSAQACALAGADVLGLDLIADRRRLCAELSGATVLDPAGEDVGAFLGKRYPDGLDAVIDTSAHAPIINESFQWVRTQGRYCLQGYYPGETPLDLLWPHAKELTIYNPTNLLPANLHRCAELLAEGRMQLDPLITHVSPVERAPEMYEMLLERREEAMAVVLDWREER